MECTFVASAGLRVRATERKVNGAADLLVEENRADRARDAEVGSDPNLAQLARAFVCRERLLQVLVASLSACLNNNALGEDQLDAFNLNPGWGAGDREADPALGAALDRPAEDLAAGHVASAVAVYPAAAFYAQL